MPEPHRTPKKRKQGILPGLWLGIEVKHNHDAGDALLRPDSRDENRFLAAHSACTMAPKGIRRRDPPQGGASRQQAMSSGLNAMASLSLETIGPETWDRPGKTTKKSQRRPEQGDLLAGLRIADIFIAYSRPSLLPIPQERVSTTFCVNSGFRRNRI